MNLIIWALFFLIVFCLPITVLSFDLLGDLVNNFGRAFGIQTNKNGDSEDKDVGNPPIYVKGQWMKSGKLKNNQIYLFAKDANSMTWFEADKYCERHDAFLAEPLTQEESDFLRNQANRLPNTNWWIGLRQFEKCECSSPSSFGRSFSTFSAEVDRTSLQRASNYGLGQTSCPEYNRKLCDGMEWRWGLSGKKPDYTYWNTATGEPNDVFREHCVTLWFKSDNQRWGNWPCSATRDGDDQGNTIAFKPLCEKTNERYDDDYDNY